MPGLLELICWAISREAIASVADRPVLHAAVLAGPAGAVAICGPSGSGKSTLAAAAALQGWTYLSDDMALIDGDDVVPFARPIMLRDGARSLLTARLPAGVDPIPAGAGERFVSAGSLGASVVPAPVGLVAVVVLDPTADGLEPITPARTCHEMLRHVGSLVGGASAAGRFAVFADLARRVDGYRARAARPLRDARRHRASRARGLTVASMVLVIVGRS